MKYHIGVKFMAIVLATVFLAMAVGSGLGIVGLLEAGLYEQSVDQLYQSSLQSQCHMMAIELVHKYASLNLGNLPQSYLDAYYGYHYTYQFREGYFFYTIRDERGSVLESTYTADAVGAMTFDIILSDVNYRVCLDNSVVDTSEYPFTESGDDMTGYVEITPKTEEEDEANIWQDIYYDFETDTTRSITYTIANLEYAEVTMYVLDGALEVESYWALLEIGYDLRYDLFWMLGVSLLLFAVCAVYLCCAAGRKPGCEKIRAGGLNRLSLDLYLAGAACLEWGLIFLGMYILQQTIRYSDIWVAFCMGAIILLVACLIFVGFCFAFVAQIKMKDAFWWHNSLIGRVCRRLGKLVKRCFRGCKGLLGMLPDVWQFVAIAGGMGFVLFLTCLFAYGNSYVRVNGFFAFILFLEVCAVIGLVAYCIYAFGVLKKGAQTMAQGDLHRLVPTAHLVGPFKVFAWQLNRLSGAARRAVEEQMKSERMKTELITNVSHDIKTPLTSIINYVDLLEKPHSDEENAEYLAVLSRQSQRLKKLIEDLMEMSKASSGTMTVEVTRLDAGESLRQALGEFSDKLEAAGLTPVVTIPDAPAYALADGRHTWRVLSNLMGNVVKYALPGTRVYIGLISTGENVVISMKNISREELNISADELTERFVRGDTSRNTEGSGLGLNIAKSLMELQRGSLAVHVDGDLFKVTLVFPAATGGDV